MTVEDYIRCKLQAFNITEADMADMIISGVPLDEEYSSENADAVGVAIIPLVERFVLAPRPSNISENGFSMSWDYSQLGRFYLWLCKRYGRTPDAEVVSLLGISTITDISDLW